MTTRRSFLSTAGAITLGAAFMPLSGCESLAVDPVLRELDFPFITPSENFFTQFGANGALENWPGVQQIPRNNWRLEIDGLVSNPLSLSFADIDADPSAFRTVLATLRCILDNNAVPGLVGTATWTGVPLRKFLDMAGVNLQQARRLRLYGADGFTNNITLDKLYNDETSDFLEPLLVIAMNNQVLRPEHGAPVRLLMPGHYGYKSIKWLNRIEVTDDDTAFGTYQQILGYDDEGIVEVNCKTTNLLKGARISAGRTRISGFAMSGDSGIESVMISIDGDSFQPARLVTLSELLASQDALKSTIQIGDPDRFPYPYRGVWALWEFDWDATPGEHLIHVKAFDSIGHEQPDTDTDPTDGLNPAAAVNVFVQ